MKPPIPNLYRSQQDEIETGFDLSEEGQALLSKYSKNPDERHAVWTLADTYGRYRACVEDSDTPTPTKQDLQDLAAKAPEGAATKVFEIIDAIVITALERERPSRSPEDIDCFPSNDKGRG